MCLLVTAGADQKTDYLISHIRDFLQTRYGYQLAGTQADSRLNIAKPCQAIKLLLQCSRAKVLDLFDVHTYIFRLQRAL